MTFGRLVTAMVTPFDQHLQIDFDQVDSLVEHLIATGTTSIVVCGTTGESPALSHDEKLALFKRVVSTAAGRAKVIAGTGSNSTADSVRFSQEAEETGVDGLLLVVPYYNKPSQEGMYQHFKAIADGVKIPCMLYNIPGRTSINMDAETTLRLAEVSNIVATKESSGDFGQISEITARAPEGFLVYSGDDILTLPMMAAGAYGIVSVASHVIGDEMTQMINAFLEGRTTDAAEWHKRLTPIFKGLFLATNPTLVKASLQMLGLQVGGVRLPLVEADEALVSEVRKRLGLLKQLHA
ncbi:4-hydroxy-tetrahydrodipicolinate synthase [Tumebacillus sp. ITR2]|uniref:4-hydroxy-tetrahydrodipicolinate synthase n=1 Tax=Tumebacillus amylolyticus TaxID=2801339 RepID=A0ABS1JFB1_9BACL|nr:4-hydroxy-tetrahydrodipicolinate synthase [Tumebacillus amylolyticus]MBL0388972.1 4-hydroxy-tetrahydrodipicolinate synthase [Tumebacillus amylolyticus]